MQRSTVLAVAAVVVYVLSLIEVSDAFVPATSSRTDVAFRGSMRGATSQSQPQPLFPGLRVASACLMCSAAAMSLRSAHRGASTVATARARVQRNVTRSVVEVYATSLRDAALSKGEVVKVTKDMIRAKDVSEDEEVRDVLADAQTMVGSFSQLEMVDVISEAMGTIQSPITRKFLTFLAQKHRCELFWMIADQYVADSYKTEGITTVLVECAEPLSDDQKEDLTQKMKTKIGAQTIKLVVQVVPALLGGMKISWDFRDEDRLLQAEQAIDLTLSSYIETQAIEEGVVMA